jgi:hypothetical protein
LAAPSVAGANVVEQWGPATGIAAPGGEGLISGVSCPVVGDCVAVGTDGNDEPFYVAETGGSWGSGTDISVSGGFGDLHGVSCTGPGYCTAVGNDGHDRPFYVSETGGVWGPATEIGGAYDELTGVSCADAGDCVAVGADGNGEPFYVAEKAGAWGSVTEITTAAGLYAPAFMGVSCAVAGDCTAVGTDGNGEPFYAAETGGSWGPATEITAPGGGLFYGVSCAGPGYCTAVGDDIADLQPVYATETGGAWGPATEITAPGISSFYGVSCHDASDCIAVGSEDGFQESFYASETSGSWGSSTEIATPGGNDQFSGVSCPAVGDCTAVGNNGSEQPFYVTETAESLSLSPATATVAAGDAKTYSAETVDNVGDDLGSVTASTTFSIAPDGSGSANGASCTEDSCSATAAGTYTVTGTDGPVTGTATLTVSVGPVVSLSLSPEAQRAVPGDAVDFTAEGFDAYSNDAGNVDASSTFSIAPDGSGSANGASCLAFSCQATAAGKYTVTATDGSATGSTTMIVVAGMPTSLTLSPDVATVPPGASQVFQAEAFDSYGNDAGDVTASTSFSIAPILGTGSQTGASCDGDACSATVPGTYSVTADDTEARLATGEAELVVAPIASLSLTPGAATVAAGVAQTFGAEGLDAGSVDLGSVTGSTVFSIAPDGSGSLSGASCAGDTCSASVPGTYTVTGADGPATGTATLTVIAGPVASLSLSPGSASVPAGQAQSFAAEGYDGYGNDLGDLTGSTTFSIAPDGSGSLSGALCAGDTCSASVPGTYTVTGTDGSATGTATLTVTSVASATSVSTSLSGGGQSGGEISVTSGTAVADHASLSGANAASATGTVTYAVYTDSACTQIGVADPPQPITTPGVLPASPPVTITTTGTFYWQATYSGDTANNGSTSTCGSEIQTVRPAYKYGADVAVILQVGSEREVPAGGAFSISVTVTNGGPKLAKNVIADLSLPSGLSVTDADGASEARAAAPLEDRDARVRAGGHVHRDGDRRLLGTGTATVNAGALSLGTLDPDYQDNFASDQLTFTTADGTRKRTVRRVHANDTLLRAKLRAVGRVL